MERVLRRVGGGEWRGGEEGRKGGKNRVHNLFKYKIPETRGQFIFFQSSSTNRIPILVDKLLESAVH